MNVRSPGLGLDVEGNKDPLEDELLGALEQLAQKTEVLATWADDMYENVRVIPQSKSIRNIPSLFLCRYIY